MKYLQLEEPVDVSAILENMGEGFLCLDQHWRFSQCNQIALTLLGKGREDIIGKALWEIFPETSGTLLDLDFHAIIEKQKPVSIETFYPPMAIWIKVRAFPYNGGTIIYYAEISNKELSKSETQSLRQRCRLCAEINPTGIFHVDEEGKAIFLNGRLLELIGLEAKDVNGCNLFEKISANCVPQVSDSLNSVLKHGLSINIEVDLLNNKTKIAKRVMIRASAIMNFGKSTVIGTVEDISEKLKARDILSDSETWFRNLANNAPVMIWTVTTNKLCDYVNNTWLKFTGRSYNQEMGNGWTDGILPDDKERVMKSFCEAFDKRDSFRIEYRYRYRNGTYRWVSDVGSPLYKPDGSFAGYVGSCADIDEQVTIYQKLESLVKEKTDALMLALETEKTLSMLKSRFLSTVSHEFRTPLSTILSSVGLIAIYNGLNQPENLQKHLDKIKQSVKHLTEIIEDFLSLDKLEQKMVKAELKNFDLKQLGTEAIEEVDNSLKTGQQIIYTYKGATTVNSDSNIIRNVILNLLSNAIKYSEKDIILEIESHNPKIVISVSDQGIGIPGKDQEQLFNKYFRAENVGKVKGTGLGLNIVQRYVEQLNGKIGFSSKENIGTRFVIEIPNEG